MRARAANRAVRADDAMRGNQEIERRAAHRRGYRAVRTRMAKDARDVTIGDDLAALRLRDEAPDGALKRRAVQRERQVEALQPAREIGGDLRGGLAKKRVLRARTARGGTTKAAYADRTLAVGPKLERNAERRAQENARSFHSKGKIRHGQTALMERACRLVFCERPGGKAC